jgi:hypothetical protein
MLPRPMTATRRRRRGFGCALSGGGTHHPRLIVDKLKYRSCRHARVDVAAGSLRAAASARARHGACGRI